MAVGHNTGSQRQTGSGYPETPKTIAWDPKRLLFGKEEHVNPSLEPSALRDQIEDLIQANVKPECLKNEKCPKRVNI